jgi:hypothetical protein
LRGAGIQRGGHLPQQERAHQGESANRESFGVEMAMSPSLTQDVRAAPADRRRSRRHPRPRSPAARSEAPHCDSVGTGLMMMNVYGSSAKQPFASVPRIVKVEVPCRRYPRPSRCHA